MYIIHREFLHLSKSAFRNSKHGLCYNIQYIYTTIYNIYIYPNKLFTDLFKNAIFKDYHNIIQFTEIIIHLYF